MSSFRTESSSSTLLFLLRGSCIPSFRLIQFFFPSYPTSFSRSTMRSLFFLLFTVITLVTAGVIPRDDDAPDFVPSRSRMLMYFTRNNAMTFQEFSDYWRGPHARLFLNTTMVQQNLLRYEQVTHITSYLRVFGRANFLPPSTTSTKSGSRSCAIKEPRYQNTMV